LENSDLHRLTPLTTSNNGGDSIVATYTISDDHTVPAGAAHQDEQFGLKIKLSSVLKRVLCKNLKIQ
jgi:hypothetical protein